MGASEAPADAAQGSTAGEPVTVLAHLSEYMPAAEAEAVTTDLEARFGADGYASARTSAGRVSVVRHVSGKLAVHLCEERYTS